MTMPCPICGGTLRDQVAGCATCPVGPGCKMLCCDRCGYETVAPHSATLEFLKRLFRIRTKEPHAS